MFRILSKLVRNLTKEELLTLADKLVELTKEEQGQSDIPKATIAYGSPFFDRTTVNFSHFEGLVQAALQKGSFCGMIIRNGTDDKKMIIGQGNFITDNDKYKFELKALGYGESELEIIKFTMTNIPSDYVIQFRQNENAYTA